MDGIGSNHPPDMADHSKAISDSLNDWLKDNPVVESEEKAREAKVYIDRGKLCIGEMEVERKAKVAPLNEKVDLINEHYRAPRNTLQTILAQIQARVSAFLRVEEQKRIAAANEARRIAEEAELRARQAEAAEQDAIGAADSGVLDVDIKAAVVEADDAFRDYQKATHRAAIAEKDGHIRLGGGFSRAVSLKNKETLTVSDPLAAIADVGMTDDIESAILKAARAYRKLHNKLPNGVIAKLERAL